MHYFIGQACMFIYPHTWNVRNDRKCLAAVSLCMPISSCLHFLLERSDSDWPTATRKTPCEKSIYASFRCVRDAMLCHVLLHWAIKTFQQLHSSKTWYSTLHLSLKHRASCSNKRCCMILFKFIVAGRSLIKLKMKIEMDSHFCRRAMATKWKFDLISKIATFE